MKLDKRTNDMTYELNICAYVTADFCYTFDVSRIVKKYIEYMLSIT